MAIKYLRFSIVFFSLINLPILAPCQFTERKIDPVAEQNYKSEAVKADQYYIHENYKFALPIYIQIYKSNPQDLQLNYRTGICYLNTTYKSKAIEYFEKAQLLDTKHIHPDLTFFLAQAYHAHHEFDKAVDHYTKYKNSLGTKHEFDIELGMEISRLIQQCQVGKTLKASPIPVSIEHLGSKINSPYSEKNPLISFDGKTLYFSSGRPATTGLQLDAKTQQYYYDIYYSTNTLSGWAPAKQLPATINTKTNDLPLSVSADGKRIYYCTSKNESGSIFYSDQKDSSWTPGSPMDKDINDIGYESGACISNDGKTFYFSSDMEGGYGGDDLYKCVLNTDNTWSAPVNLGQKVNSEFDEDDPFILNDNKTLYFSSQGHSSMGGYDIFVSKYDDKKMEWENPANVGYPINSAGDEISISWSGDGKTGYYSEENEEGYGLEDIYKISFEHISKTVISKPASILSNNIGSKPIKTDILKSYSSQPKPGTILKEQVHFAFNESHNLTEYSKNKIASIIELLQKYPTLAIEIEGFSDKTGNVEYNHDVSLARANVVFNYLLKKGISKNRMQVKLYKENFVPTNEIKSAESDIRNRRVEFKVIAAIDQAKK